ncbi:MAG: creatininase family protein [Gemmatimonadota bacterium]
MTPRPYILAEQTWDFMRAAKVEVAILPWGATEAHNKHLPYGTDTIEAESVAAESARLATEAGASILVLPAVPFGVHTSQTEIPCCLNMNPSTQAALLRDLVVSLAPHGIRKLVILNGHGGNDFRAFIRELQPTVPMLLAQLNWYAAVAPAGFFDAPGDHAGELETSVMQHLAPALTRPLPTAGPGRAHPHTIRAFREGWAWTPRHWVEVTDDTGVGNPAAATADKGRKFFDACCGKIAEFLVELSAVEPDQLYEKGST